MPKPTIGCIGQGFIGKNYSDDFEERGYDVVRYDLGKFARNKLKIKKCDIVFIAVPTPSTPEGFDYSIVEGCFKLIGKSKIAVIKSTILPGTTNILQKKYPQIFLFHSPEFLTEKTARHDAASPARNIIGFTAKSKSKSTQVMNVLPVAPYEAIIPAAEAELIKYAGNCFFYFKVIYMNLVADLCAALELDFETVKDGLAGDKRIGRTHLDVVHDGGRGAGGHCFIKDMAAFAEIYNRVCKDDVLGNELLKSIQNKNIELLINSKKNLDLLRGVYGDGILKK